MNARWDALVVDARLATMRVTGEPYWLIENAALGIRDGAIVFADAAGALPDRPEALARTVESLGGALVTPGLVDCHTHLVFGGDRADEFEKRLGGATYEDIARAGGGSDLRGQWRFAGRPASPHQDRARSARPVRQCLSEQACQPKL